jgi:hypothetical protein
VFCTRLTETMILELCFYRVFEAARFIWMVSLEEGSVVCNYSEICKKLFTTNLFYKTHNDDRTTDR